MLELHRQDAKALSLAAVAAAALLGVLTLRLGPYLFRPWPAALLVLLASGMAGALSRWAAGGGLLAFPLTFILLPFIRLLLLYLHHGPPPWPSDQRLLLFGDGFPWWAASSLLASLYAGSLAACWTRAALSLERILNGAIHARPMAATDARRAALESERLYLGSFFLTALVLSFIGEEGEGTPALLCLFAFLAAGIAFTGLIQARSMKAAWHAEGAMVAEGCEEEWLAGHWRWLLPPFLFLPLLPWSGRSLSLSGALSFLARLSLKPGAIPGRTTAIPDLIQRMPTLRSPGFWERILTVCYLVFFVVFLSLASFMAVVLCFMILRRLFHLVGDWFAGLPSFLQAVRDFVAAVLSFFRRNVVARLAAGSSRFTRFSSRRRNARRSRFDWPPTAVRRLFARLVLWGRAQGLPLSPVLTPAEIARGLSAIVPREGEDLVYLVEVYRRERYGEERLDRFTRLLYRRAWERIVRNKSGGTTPPKGGGT